MRLQHALADDPPVTVIKNFDQAVELLLVGLLNENAAMRSAVEKQ